MKKIMIRILYISIFLVQPSLVWSDESKGDENSAMKLKSFMTEEKVNDFFRRVPVPYIETLKNQKKKRSKLFKNMYKNEQIKNIAEEFKVTQDPVFLAKMYNFKQELMIQSIIGYRLNSKIVDLEALAKQEYESSKSDYFTRKKIKLAVIYIRKSKWGEEKAKQRIADAKGYIDGEKDNPNAFYEAAKKYSDDPLASKGGVNKRWFIAPIDMDKATKIQKVAFKIKEIGDITEIVEDKQGYHLLRLLNITPSTLIPFEQEKLKIIENVKVRLQKQETDEFFSELKELKLNTTSDDFLLKIIEKYLEEHKAVK